MLNAVSPCRLRSHRLPPGNTFEARFDAEEHEIVFRRIAGTEDWLAVLSECPVSMDGVPPAEKNPQGAAEFELAAEHRSYLPACEAARRRSRDRLAAPGRGPVFYQRHRHHTTCVLGPVEGGSTTPRSAGLAKAAGARTRWAHSRF